MLFIVNRFIQSKLCCHGIAEKALNWRSTTFTHSSLLLIHCLSKEQKHIFMTFYKQNNNKRIESEWMLFIVNWAPLQLCHGKHNWLWMKRSIFSIDWVSAWNCRWVKVIYRQVSDIPIKPRQEQDTLWWWNDDVVIVWNK
jgi:hypothetical protein